MPSISGLAWNKTERVPQTRAEQGYPLALALISCTLTAMRNLDPKCS